MLEPRDVSEKKLNAETQRIVGELQLQKYGNFIDKYNADLELFKDQLPNKLNIRSEPILLENSRYDSVSVLHLVASDNKLLSRILASLASLCGEVKALVDEAQGYYSTCVFYGELHTTWDNLKSVSELVEHLQKIQCFVERCQQVMCLLFQQLSAIVGKEYNGTQSASCFPELLECLAQLLVCLLTLDNLLTTQTIKEHFTLYQRSIKGLLHNSSKYGMDKSQILALDKALSNLEITLLMGNIFKTTLERLLDEKYTTSIKSTVVSVEISAYINQLLVELERDNENVFFTQIWLQVNALVVFEHHIYGGTEKKILKRLLDVNKKALICTLHGNVAWYPEVFLLKHIPSLNKIIDDKLFDNLRLNKVTLISKNLPKDSHTLILQACHFLLEIYELTEKDMSTFHMKHLNKASNLLIDCLKLIKKIKDVVTWVINYHVENGRPMAKSVVVSLCRSIEILKSFQLTFHRKSLALVYLLTLISQQLSHRALLLLQQIRKNFTKDRAYKEEQLDVLSALHVCERNLKGPNSNQRILIMRLALSASGLSNEILNELNAVINRLELMGSFHSLVDRHCDCSFLYWHQSYMFPTYFSKMIESKMDLSGYYIILSALCDFTAAGDKLDFSMDKHLLAPLNQIVETNLRLQTHQHLQLPPSDPFKNTLQLNFSKFLPAPVNKYYIDIKKDTEHYLSTMFYNLTTVFLHDWKTYGEMRRLAKLQYNLDTVEDDLPMQTLEQGLDVLEIMRNINVFVSKYLYNLNDQVFIEESSNNKHLNSINISHVANSIRTHGIGIMNTTVNFTYQFLQEKFHIFSQFMFDEHIKSRLSKDIRYFLDRKVEFSHMYPYERAEKFNVGIKNLGLNQNGLSYLDLFRILITHIGNAMGYIRMIRSGGRRFLSRSTCFIPNLKELDQLSELMDQEDKLSDLTKRSAVTLCDDLKTLADNFEEATEYFQLLVKVFIQVFQNPNNMHLKNFYVIVPPLTINFVENMLTRKERLNKKHKIDASFTDDGFVIGLAYIVELLGQEKQLNSLHWFHSIQAKFANEKKKIVQQQTLASKQDAKLQQTLQLSEKRLNAFEREFQLLYYSFTSARIFFQT